ncbi:peptidase family M1 containing protein (macronuclear) [Tetrahymena thermophila SB210]|uniref:Peptidase family M1 containing protein n=1 Tax=Tetrahymena thermophila (strain SB210) TaxID=312017 RepID=Q23ZG7_TETTS|nr:peptidase family M1 containing protein [Tetrahymena thermophila SB210]EAS01890.2 peptidase family M1 containing protein [Tetrahymena thermophila SB210]|eukprot:XP_001022135.2 peptidase family M1 containing protein [Tetrahymena thermophila SB210]
MLRPSPVPSFVATSANRSVSPINANNSQKQLSFATKERTNSFSSIQPTSNPMNSVQSLQRQIITTPKPISIQSNEAPLVKNSLESNKFFGLLQNQEQIQKQKINCSVQVRLPPTHHNQNQISTNSENTQPSQENCSKFNIQNFQSTPKNQTALCESKPQTKVLQNSQSVNVIVPLQSTQSHNITKIINTPTQSSTKNQSMHMKKESLIQTPQLGVKDASFQDQIKQSQCDLPPSLNSQGSLNQSIPSLTHQGKDNKILVNKARSNSHFGGNSPSITIPTFSAEPNLISTPQNVTFTQQQGTNSLIKIQSTSNLSEGTPSNQQYHSNQFFSSVQGSSDKLSFNHTQPLPPNHMKNVVQQQNLDKQAFMIQDLQQKILMLLNENEKQSYVIKQKQSQIGQIENQLKNFKEQNDDLKQQCDAQTIAVRELSQTLKASQNKEVESLKLCEKLQENIKQLSKEHEKSLSIIKHMEQEKEESISQHQAVLQQKEQSYKQLLTDMEDKISMLVEENNQLNEIVQTKLMKESSISQQPYSEEQIQQIAVLIQENQKLQIIIGNLESKLKEQKTLVDEKEENLSKLNEEYQSLLSANDSIKQEFNAFEEKIKDLLKENEALIQKTQNFEDVIQEAKRVQELKSENEILLENLKLVTKDKQKVQFEMQQKEEEFQQQQALLLEKCAEQTNQIEEKYSDERAQFEQKQEEFSKEKEDLLNQFEKFKEENTILAKQISEIEEKIENLISENQELSIQNQDQRYLIETLEKKQESYTDELKKQFDISLRQKIEENLMQLTNRYNEEINKLHNEIIKRNESVVEEKEKNRQLEEQIQRLKFELNKLIQETKELKEFANIEEEQNYEQQKQYQQQLEFENNEVKNQIEILEQEKLNLNQKIKEILDEQKNKDQLIQEYQQQILNSDFSQGNNNQQIQQLIQTQNELIEQSLKKDDENKELIELIQNTKHELDLAIQQYQQLLEENGSLKDQIKAFMQEKQEKNTPQAGQQQLELDQIKKERDELLQIKQKQQIELSKKNKELIERKEELDHLQLKLEQSFSQHYACSCIQLPQANNTTVLNNQQQLNASQSQKLNSSNYSSYNQTKNNNKN